MQKILSTLRRAVDEYNLIEEGDKIAVGVSGGKDSVLLAAALKNLQLFYPKKFDLIAISLDMTGGKTDYSKLEKFFNEIGLEYKIIPTNIFEVVFDIRHEKNPCSLCSKMRRGALASEVQKLGFNKIALGHHADDLIETFFLSMYFEGRLSTFSPKTYLSNTKITQIRPLILTEEKNIVATCKKLNLPIVKNVCPADKKTQRQFIKNEIEKLKEKLPFAKERILGAITHPERYNLFDKIKK